MWMILVLGTVRCIAVVIRGETVPPRHGLHRFLGRYPDTFHTGPTVQQNGVLDCGLFGTLKYPLTHYDLHTNAIFLVRSIFN